MKLRIQPRQTQSSLAGCGRNPLRLLIGLGRMAALNRRPVLRIGPCPVGVLDARFARRGVERPAVIRNVVERRARTGAEHARRVVRRGDIEIDVAQRDAGVLVSGRALRNDDGDRRAVRRCRVCLVDELLPSAVGMPPLGVSSA